MLEPKTEELTRVAAAVLAVADGSGFEVSDIEGDTNLITEIGLTSLSLVDLALELELRMGLSEFPIQQWIDEENAKGDVGFTLASLAAKCREAGAAL